jgi:1-acyl-sn-glycerol-3-phosphate acyltransferase
MLDMKFSVFTSSLVHILPWLPMRLVLRLFTRFTVIGLERLPTSGNVIFAMNHVSELDPIALQYALPMFTRFMPVYFVALTKQHYSSGDFGMRSRVYGGTLFKLLGAYPVYPGLHDLDQSLVHHLRILRKGYSVCIFPEGKRSKDGTIGRVRPGCAHLALHTDTPVVPVRIRGAFGVRLTSFFAGRHTVQIEFGEPITDPYQSSMGQLDHKERLQLYTEAIERQMKQL